MKNYYHILQIPTHASQAEIKAAYKARLAGWNASDNQNMARYMDIEEAWENLGDDLRRQWYDDRFLAKIKQQDRTKQAKASKIYQEVSADLAKKKTSPSLTKKVAVGGLSGGAIFLIMHFALMVYHLAPSPEPEFKKIEYTDLDTSAMRQKLDSMVQQSFIKKSPVKQNDTP